MNSLHLPAPIILRTGSRLHCGLFSDPSAKGNAFQGMGMMVDSPGYQIAASCIVDTDRGHQIEAEDEIRERIELFLNRLDENFGNPTGRHLVIRVINSIPLHCGFGSGTQLALAVGKIWAWFHQQELSTLQIARVLNRGKRSCIGTFGFDQGGMLIDHGHAPGESFGTCHSRILLPESWRILLIRPLGVQGVSGESETKAFEQLPEIAPKQVERLEQLLKIMKEQSSCFASYSAAIREYGKIVGESFASIQDGCFTAPVCHEIFNFLTEHGLQGIAQSSWGPTMFAICETAQQAEEIKKRICSEFSDLDVSIARCLSTGGSIEITTSGSS